MAFCHIADAASIEQHHVGGGLGLGEGIAPSHELRGDGFAVALVHLAAVGFYEYARHDSRKAGNLIQNHALGKAALRRVA